MSIIETNWAPTLELRHILEWEDDANKLVLQQKWTKASKQEGYGAEDWDIEEEWRDIPLWRFNGRDWEPR